MMTIQASSRTRKPTWRMYTYIYIYMYMYMDDDDSGKLED
jgi:hypothetical protein